jgi:two-component system phosphate regulon sensor histidine kinase PhoR
LTDTLKNNAFTLELKITPLLYENKIQELNFLVKNLDKNINTRITIINPDGVVLADSEEDPKIMENHKNRPEIQNALKGKLGKSLRYSYTFNNKMLYVAMPIENEGKILGVLRLSLFLTQIDSLFGDLKIKIFEIVLIIVILSLLVAFIFSRSLTKPIKELVVASRKVAEGDFNVKVLLKNEDELKELSDSFNNMIYQIISSMQEGFVVLDKNEIIKLCNENFKKIVSNKSIEGKHYWEVLKEPELNKLIDKIRNEKKSISERIEIYNKTFLCSITFLPIKQDIVVLLSDISKIIELEKVKKDFIVNISHELKTPLTAIKGFIETLEEEENIKNKDYVNIIRRHTDRLINIVNDLLFLSKLEEKDEKLEIEKVDMQELISKILKMFEQKLKSKNLSLKFEITDELLLISADPFKIEQMFINLIDNAIKYTDEGEISISLERKDKSLKIEIKDEGIGIPKEHLPRIFERFYVVDKSRSRKLGGTGLGLSIVKHIILLHNGSIDVESSPGKGTKFIIILPINFI